jgi:hypothetical protein
MNNRAQMTMLSAILLICISSESCQAVEVNDSEKSNNILTVKEVIRSSNYIGDEIEVKGYLKSIYPDVALFGDATIKRGDRALFIDDRSIESIDDSGRKIDLATFLDLRGCTNRFVIVKGTLGKLEHRDYWGISKLTSIKTFSTANFDQDEIECFVNNKQT